MNIRTTLLTAATGTALLTNPSFGAAPSYREPHRRRAAPTRRRRQLIVPVIVVAIVPVRHRLRGGDDSPIEPEPATVMAGMGADGREQRHRWDAPLIQPVDQFAPRSARPAIIAMLRAWDARGLQGQLDPLGPHASRTGPAPELAKPLARNRKAAAEGPPTGSSAPVSPMSSTIMAQSRRAGAATSGT